MLLLRGATLAAGAATSVSIHAPLARSNEPLFRLSIPPTCFNTCSSCEEQLCNRHCRHNCCGFNTCSSCEEQPCESSDRTLNQLFQYMLLLRGATLPKIRVKLIKCFNTCSSCEEQRRHIRGRKASARFNTCSSCEEQRKIQPACSCNASFNTCSSCEEQLRFHLRVLTRHGFNTCSSCEEQRIAACSDCLP